MTATPNVQDALELVASLEACCLELRRLDGQEVRALVAEIERLVLEIRDKLDPPGVNRSEP